MKGILKAAKQANGRSHSCKKCPLHPCQPQVWRVCYDSFMEGFKKGINWYKQQKQ